MTCIVAIEDDNGVTMMADSASVADYHRRKTDLQKVFKTGNFLIGYTTSFRFGQLLQYKMIVPEQECKDDLEYLATVFIDAVRECLSENGWKKAETDGEEVGGNFLLGYKGKLYRVDSDFQCNRHSAGYDSVGYACVPALASLHTSQIIGGLSTEARLRLALFVSSEIYPSQVAEPFIIKKQERTNGDDRQ